MTDKATPRPWLYDVVGIGGRHDNPIDVCEIRSIDNHVRIAEHVGFDDAALIVRAVNAHDQLVEALKRIVRIKDWNHDEDWQARNEYESAADQAASALRAAGVEP